MALDLSSYRRQLARLGRGEPLPPPAEHDPDRARLARLAAAEQAERDRLERVKVLASKAKKARREFEAAGKAYLEAEAAAVRAENARQAAYDERLRLSNVVGQLEWGTDCDERGRPLPDGQVAA